MGRYVPGAILAVFGVVAYVIGCVLFIAYRRERGRGGTSKSLLAYAVAMMLLGILALGAGLYALEINEMHALGG